VRAADGTGVGRRSNDALCPSCPLFRVLVLVREVVVASLRLRMDERSEVDAEVEASDVREEGSLARDRDW
jgi:hypothetical protein